MAIVKDAKDLLTRPGSQVHWVRLLVIFLIFVIISFGLAYLFQSLVAHLSLPVFELEILAYSTVFVSTLVSNMTIIAPVPFAVSIMIAAATKWNPFLIALFAAAGGSLGELSGYYAGYFGKKVAIPDSLFAYHRVEGWINRYGFWAIAFLAFQPVIPFDVGGMIAGLARMPLHKFLPALFLGKLPKYIILILAGIGLISRFPFMNR
jgi:membrane protein YqaA with SNARE-associated domain